MLGVHLLAQKTHKAGGYPELPVIVEPAWRVAMGVMILVSFVGQDVFPWAK